MCARTKAPTPRCTIPTSSVRWSYPGRAARGFNLPSVFEDSRGRSLETLISILRALVDEVEMHFDGALGRRVDELEGGPCLAGRYGLRDHLGRLDLSVRQPLHDLGDQPAVQAGADDRQFFGD